MRAAVSTRGGGDAAFAHRPATRYRWWQEHAQFSQHTSRHASQATFVVVGVRDGRCAVVRSRQRPTRTGVTWREAMPEEPVP